MSTLILELIGLLCTCKIIIINNNNNNNNGVIYFDYFGVEQIPQEIKAFIKHTLHNKNIITNIFRIQAYDSIICE